MLPWWLGLAAQVAQVRVQGRVEVRAPWQVAAAAQAAAVQAATPHPHQPQPDALPCGGAPAGGCRRLPRCRCHQPRHPTLPATAQRATAAGFATCWRPARGTPCRMTKCCHLAAARQVVAWPAAQRTHAVAARVGRAPGSLPPPAWRTLAAGGAQHTAAPLATQAAAAPRVTVPGCWEAQGVEVAVPPGVPTALHHHRHLPPCAALPPVAARRCVSWAHHHRQQHQVRGWEAQG